MKFKIRGSANAYKRLNEIEKMDNEDKGSILKVLDGFIKSVNLKYCCSIKIRKPGRAGLFLL